MNIEYSMTDSQVQALYQHLVNLAKDNFDLYIKYRLENNYRLAEMYETQFQTFERSSRVVLMYATKTDKI